MTGYRKRILPAEITVFAGHFDSQPLAFAHLLDLSPALDLDHVEIIEAARARRRLAPYFDTPEIDVLTAGLATGECLVLILPAAHSGMACPFPASPLLRALGSWRGRITRLEEVR